MAERTAASRRAGLQACQRPPGSPKGLRYFQFCYAQQLPTELPATKFSSGQNVVPYFEGWIRNPDGTFDLVFGYFNRNWEEALAIPAGPDNVVEPGGPDRGQPTYFLPRRQGWLFRVRVPKDFGKQVVTWTIKANGRTEKAYGELLPVEEITERIIMTRGNLNPGDSDPNQAPAITIAPATAPNAGAPIALTAMVTDDGLPKPRAPVQRAPTATDATRIQAQANSSAVARPRPGPIRRLRPRPAAHRAGDRDPYRVPAPR